MVDGEEEDGGMRVGIDGRFWSQAGIGRYIRNLVGELQKLDRKNDYYIFLLKEDFPKVNLSRNFSKVLANFRWYTFEEQIKFPPLLEEYNLDLVHFPHLNVPIFYSGDFVVTIHDLIHQKFNMRATRRSILFYSLKQLGYRTVFKSAVKRSRWVITVSEYVKKDLIKKWRIVPGKINVIYEGFDQSLAKPSKKLPHGVKPPFILYVGNAHPHKNVDGLIKAFLILRRKYQYLQLILVGKKDPFWKKVLEIDHRDIIFTGKVDDSELAALYKNAQVYVQPSFEEGFGLPLLEAFSLGCPVVSSNGGSLPEIGGKGAVYFNPKNIPDMVEKIANILDSPVLRRKLVAEGSKRSKEFSWKKSAAETLKVYKLAVNKG